MIAPCWIICSPRCGSTYLCDLLNSTNLFEPPFKEYFNLDIKTPEFAPFCKIQPSQWIKNNLNVQKIKDKLPNLHFVQITRKNFIDRAASFYLAKESNIWAIGDSDCFIKPKNIYMNTHIKIDEKNIKRLTNSLLVEIKKEKEIIKKINHPVLQIDYNEIIEHPSLAVMKVLQHLGCSKNIKIQSVMERMPEKPEKEKVKKMIRHFIKIKLI